MTSEFNYRRYLASREWALLKEQVRERSEGWCEFCELAPYEETHHITYERIGHEHLDDLLATCKECHRWLSAKTQHSPFSWMYHISERLSREDERPPLHFVYQRLAVEVIPGYLRHPDIYWAHCRPHPAIGKCRWCTGILLPVEDFYWAVRSTRGEV